MFTDGPESESGFRKEKIREQIEKIGHQADSLARILPNITNSEEKRKIEQMIEIYRLDANRLSERIRGEVTGDLVGNLQKQELTMSRKYIDCRDIPNEIGCTLAISGDDEDEVIELAVMHACRSHGQKDTYELRDQLRSRLKDEPGLLGRRAKA